MMLEPWDLAPTDKVAQLSGGYRMVWQRDGFSLKIVSKDFFKECL